MRDTWRHTLTVDDSWVRPLPARWWRVDVPVALMWFVVATASTEGYRSLGALNQDHTAIWLQYVFVGVPCVALCFRRRFPLPTVAFTTVAWIVSGQIDEKLTVTLGIQFIYIFAIYSATAWCRTRIRGAWVIGGSLVLLFGWVGYTLIFDRYRGPDVPHAIPGWLGATIVTILTNVIYLGGVVLLGILEWRNLRRHSHLEEQARTIDTQAAELRRQAVDAERLRIARELHDVVAHHVSVIGVQAGAARRVLDKQPDAARDALAGIERSSRSAVSEMRALLGSLRSSNEPDRAPTPGLTDVDVLISDYRSAGLAVDLSTVGDLPPTTPEVPPGVGLAIYRTVQEALANVQRHSTATAASVVTRFGRHTEGAWAEVEILDNGRTRPTGTGTGLGLVGMRERVAVLGGEAEIGPRETGGFRVRVRLPFD